MPAMLATRFQSHTASSFIASKLSSHRWVASQAYAGPVGPNLFGKGLADSILLSPDMTHSRMNSLPPGSTLAGQHRTSRRQPSQADRKIPVGAGLGLGGIPTINDNAVGLLSASHVSRASPAPTIKCISTKLLKLPIKPPRSTYAHTHRSATHSSRLAERIQSHRC